MLKVASKARVAEVLKAGGSIDYCSISAKVYLRNKAGKVVNAIRFDTFLKWPRTGECFKFSCARDDSNPLSIIRVKSDWLSDKYVLQGDNSNDNK